MNSIKIYTAFLLATVLTACSGVKTNIEQPPNVDANAQGLYQIGIGDELSVNVWRNQELSIDIAVRPDGFISLPLVGDIAANGETAEQLAKKIKQQLGSYVRNPEVTVIVVRANSAEFMHRVRLTGAVRNPISIPHRSNMTVLDLILSAGGVTEFAANNKSLLYRTINGEVKVYPIYLTEILEQGNVRTNYKLAPGDIVTVPERRF